MMDVKKHFNTRVILITKTYVDEIKKAATTEEEIKEIMALHLS